MKDGEYEKGEEQFEAENMNLKGNMTSRFAFNDVIFCQSINNASFPKTEGDKKRKWQVDVT